MKFIKRIHEWEVCTDTFIGYRYQKWYLYYWLTITLFNRGTQLLAWKGHRWYSFKCEAHNYNKPDTII